MPPKKKARITSNAKHEGGAAPATMEDVGPFQLKLKEWITQVYSIRRGTSEALGWPIESGGSILSICQRCWKDKPGLLNMTCDLLAKTGIGEFTSEVFEEKFMKTEEWLLNLRGIVSFSFLAGLPTQGGFLLGDEYSAMVLG